MSVTMHLYKVVPNVKYNGYYNDYLTEKDLIVDPETGKAPYQILEASLGCPDVREDYVGYLAWEDKMHASAWSDGVKHERIDLTYLKSLFKANNYRGCNRILCKLNHFPIETFDNGHIIRKFIVVDEVAYAQGWFFKKRFFNRKMTFNFCITRDEMIKFFDKYIDYRSHDTRGKESVQKFLDAWEDGMNDMIFECAF